MNPNPNPNPYESPKLIEEKKNSTDFLDVQLKFLYFTAFFVFFFNCFLLSLMLYDLFKL
jgi:hypothetical protein